MLELVSYRDCLSTDSIQPISAHYSIQEELTVHTPSVALLGTGLMGKPMACRLLAAGYQVIIWNRTAAKAQAMAAEFPKLVVALTPAHAVAAADIVITMLENGSVVQQVVAAIGQALPRGRYSST
jgi:3-hydroxyisobutyrate dehydrogenase-like beta-hydroxyacid dehydrogenase